MTNDQCAIPGFVIRHSSFLRHWAFVIRHYIDTAGIIFYGALHVFTRNSAQTTTSNAAAWRGTFSARITAALHFRAALSADAPTRS